MDYEDYLNQFWIIDAEFDFTGMETRLYFLLLDIALHKKKFNDIKLHNTFLMIFVGCSKTQLQRGRRRLRKADLIDYMVENRCGMYSILTLKDYQREDYDPYEFIQNRYMGEE